MVLQCAIIFGCLAVGELVVWLTGTELPSSIIGMLTLTLLLSLKAVMLYFDIIRAQWLPILVASGVSTLIVIVVTGWMHQFTRKHF